MNKETYPRESIDTVKELKEESVVVLGLSGGMDSATLLGRLLYDRYKVICVSFKYPSKHNRHELKQAQNLVDYFTGKEQEMALEKAGREAPMSFNEAKKDVPLPYGRILKYMIIDVSHTFNQLQSNLLQQGGEIPEGHYEAESMSVTVVPGRNTVFAANLLAVAESFKATGVAMAVHSGDHHIYPDCRPKYLEALNVTIVRASEAQVRLFTPYRDADKYTMLKDGHEFTVPVPYHLTRTCYKDEKASCGKCGSCNERLEAWNKLGKEDPIEYIR